MTYTQLILFSVLLNVGQAYIIWHLYKHNVELIRALKDIQERSRQALSILNPSKKMPPMPPPRKKSFWKYYDN
jgi:hypothetical protein